MRVRDEEAGAGQGPRGTGLGPRAGPRTQGRRATPERAGLVGGACGRAGPTPVAG